MSKKRLIQLSVIVGLGVALPANVLLFKNLAFAEGVQSQGLVHLTAASKAYESGDYDTAQQEIDQAFSSGLSNDLAARAMLMRAQIHEKTGKLSRALSDYSSALWMQNLSPADRKAATDGKERIVASMGLNADGSSSASSSSSNSWDLFGVFSPKTSSTTQAATAPAQTPERTQVASAETQSTRSSWDLLGLFSSDSKPAQTAAPVQPTPPPPVATTTQKVTTKKPNPTVAAKSNVKQATTRTVAVKVNKKPAATVQTASMTSSDAGVGAYLIDFGASNGENAARSKAQVLKTKLSSILINRDLLVQASQQRAGAYHVVAGPYKTKVAATALCNAMMRQGVSCQVTP